ncbi:DUF1738 domain-containing protein [Salmonella enterica]|nr:DUF1738 domain-containing protein [Salmonella enterica]EAU7918626.1 DUF1738 domain-containing protein [Salmonella enterica]EKC9749419.1 DUF1738 domain-containing protein [Salmonella enterica]
MAEVKKPFHEQVAERLIEQLKAGTAPWQKPWEPGMPGSFIPLNPTTGKRYKGINAIQLMAQGHADPRWMTYKQAAAAGAQVRRGEKGTPIQYWKFSEEQTKTDEQTGKPVLDANGDPVKVTVQLERPRVFFATVFNAEQIDGLPPLERKEQTWNAVERAEHILAASGATIRHGEHDRAFYRPSTDSIHLPDKGQFPTADNYYATALHELGHWTGHPSRLDRDLAHPFGSEGYAKEELRAEIASMILGDELGIGHDPGQHAAYVGSWIKALQEDPLEIFRAAADAEKIQDFVLAFEQKQIQEQTTQQAIEPAQGATMEQQQDQVARPAIAPADELIAQTLRMYRAGAEPAEGNQSLAALTESTLGFELPADWSGRVQVQANVEVEHDGERFVEPAGDREPEFWGVYAHHESGGHQWLADFAGPDAQTNAEALADRLAVIDAYATANEYEQAAKFARIHEERVRRDPNSTDEDRVAAKEARKAAEGTAMLHDEDLQRRIADYEREQQEMAQAMNAAEQPAAAQAPAKPERAYLNVPFKEKDEVKALGARWDRQERAWYVPAGVDPAPFAKWAREGATAAVEARAEAPATQPTAERRNAAQERVYLAVPYGERQVAKAAGAQWDKVAKSWYAGPNADMDKLQRWLPDNVPTQQSPAVTPEDEFAEALKSMGCVVTPGGGHPIMDGKKHRIETEGDKKGEKSGFYVGHLDGHPAGYIKNNRTGVEMKWKAKGYALDPAEKAKMQAEAAAKLAARAEEQERLHEATAQRIGRQAQSLVPITEPTPYLRDKGLQLHAGVLTDQEGQKTYIPAYDADGKQWTMQYIQEDGTKRFAKDSRKEGCFHVVGGMDALAAAPALVIGEGYATAATVAEALGHATVAAFDSGNLQAVAEALHAKFPDKPVVIAGDDDRQVQITQGVNPGRTKAQEAAKAVGGKAIFPIFAPGENAYPKELPPITPESYRNHLHAEKRLADAATGKVQLSEADTAKLKESLLSDDQLAALSNMKKHTDFNDLSERSSLGKDGVERQVRSAVGKVLLDEGQRQKVQQLKQQEIEQQEQRQRRARTY